MSQTELAILDAKGKEVGKKSVSEEIFSNKAPQHLLHQVVRWQRARKRAGTHATQTRATMSGGGRKPWKQKGTGNARAGSNTSPVWVGGGVAHGPKPRDYDYRLNKGERKRALVGALSERNAAGKLLLVKDFGLTAIKTKEARTVLSQLGVAPGASVLIVLKTSDTVVKKSVQNIEGVKVTCAAGINVYDILNHKYLMISEPALAEVESRFINPAAE